MSTGQAPGAIDTGAATGIVPNAVATMEAGQAKPFGQSGGAPLLDGRGGVKLNGPGGKPKMPMPEKILSAAAFSVFIAGIVGFIAELFFGGLVEGGIFDTLDSLYLTFFGAIMVIVDLPEEFPLSLVWLQETKRSIEKYCFFLSLLTGKGLWYIFLGTSVFFTLWSNDNWYFGGLMLGFYVFGVGCYITVFGMTKSKKFETYRVSLKKGFHGQTCANATDELMQTYGYLNEYAKTQQQQQYQQHYGVVPDPPQGLNAAGFMKMLKDKIPGEIHDENDVKQFLNACGIRYNLDPMPAQYAANARYGPSVNVVNIFPEDDILEWFEAEAGCVPQLLI